ncbi:MAG: GntR family transcriptional regulator [Planctomycetota bacterium]|jgi:hypothetical protein
MSILSQLENDIQEGKYRQNDKLPSVSSLAKQFNVSYGKAHAAVTALAERGVVSMEPGRGSFVKLSKTFAVEWLWIGDHDFGKGGVFDYAIDYVRNFSGTDMYHDISLSTSFLDVRNMPSPKAFAESCRMRCVEGLLVCGHSTHYLDYVNELSQYIPLVSLFGNWADSQFSYVAADPVSVIDDLLGEWKKAGTESVGFLSANLEHPNYSNVCEQTSRYAEKNGISFSDDNIFIGNEKDTANWLVGRLSRDNSPRHWITATEGFAYAIIEAAEVLKIDWKKELDVLTFSIIENAYDRFEKSFSVGIYDFSEMLETGISCLREGLKKGDKQEFKVPMQLLHGR